MMTSRYKRVFLFSSVLLFLRVDLTACDSSADSNPVRVVSAAYRRPEMSSGDSESSSSSIVKKVVKPDFELGGGGGGGGGDWREYSMEITREDRMARDEHERQNDKFMKNVPKVINRLGTRLLY